MELSFTYVRRAGCLRRGILPVLFRAFRAQSYCALRHRSRFIALLQALLQAAVYILETLSLQARYLFSADAASSGTLAGRGAVALFAVGRHLDLLVCMF